MMSEPTLDSILASRSLRRSDLNRKCSSEHLHAIALKLTSWKTLCPFIGLSREDEEDIEEENRKNMDRKVAMLRRWSEKFCDEATYLKLAEGFESLKRRDWILELLKLLAQPQSSGAAVSSSSCSSSSGSSSSGASCRPGRDEMPRAKKKKPPIPKLSDKPCPSHLLKLVGKNGKEIYIREYLSSNWEDLLMYFNLEPAEALIKTIAKNTRYQAEDACREVLLKWLSGKGRQPVTWETLVDVIEDMGLSELASDIRAELLPA